MPFLEQIGEGVVIHTPEITCIPEFNLIILDAEINGRGRYPFKDDPVNSGELQLRSKIAAACPLPPDSCQRRLSTNGEPRCPRKLRSYARAGHDEEGIS